MTWSCRGRVSMLHVGKELTVLGCGKGYDAASLSVGLKGIS